MSNVKFNDWKGWHWRKSEIRNEESYENSALIHTKQLFYNDPSIVGRLIYASQSGYNRC